MKYLEIQELYPNNVKCVENIYSFITPVLRETPTTFITDQCYLHNITGLTNKDIKSKLITWRKTTGTRFGDQPCEYTPSFKIIKVHNDKPKHKTHYIYVNVNEEQK
jgi:hypothetical protein